MPKKGGMFAALLLGKKKPMMGDEPESDMEADEEYSEVPPDFEDEAIKFMPELEGDDERMMAFWKAVKACVGG